jgi:hypothetical protein
MSPELGSDSPTPESTDQASSTPANSGLTSSVVEIPQKYESIMQKYAKVSSTSILPLPTLVYVEACLKVARFLLTIAMNGGWNDKVVALLVQGKLTAQASESEDDNGQIVLDPKLLKESGVTRLSIAEWTMRAAGSHMQDIPIMDQVRANTSCYIRMRPELISYASELDHCHKLYGISLILYWIPKKSCILDARERPDHTAFVDTSTYQSHKLKARRWTKCETHSTT